MLQRIAFSNAIGWSHQSPIVVRPPRPGVKLQNTIQIPT
jgi:hypothetical protein